MQGLIHIYYGDGKGKTTAGTGLCVLGGRRRPSYTCLSIFKRRIILRVQDTEKIFPGSLC